MTPFEALYRTESRRVLATLIRLLGDFELAEEALHDAFVAAAEQWPRDGTPQNPRAWLVSTGRFCALARRRRRARFEQLQPEVVRNLEASIEPSTDEPDVGDDRLRLIFTCCHPVLDGDGQIALTLREVCGLTTEQIAAAFLAKPTTIAQRIVRTKRSIREQRIPYVVPSKAELPERLERVLHVIYLVFNEGYGRTLSGALPDGQSAAGDLASEAVGLARWLAELLPDPDVFGLLALLLFHESRRAARATAGGELVLLSDQDRTLWDREPIREGEYYLARAWARPPLSSYTLQAAIAAKHARAPNSAATDWAGIVRLYDLLLVAEPSPVVELNRAVAVAELLGPSEGLRLIDAIHKRDGLENYRYLHAARADLLRRLGDNREAAEAYRRALSLTNHQAEEQLLLRRLAEVGPC